MRINHLFRRLRAAPFLPGAEALPFVVAAADFLADLNAIHPFREGNGRAQLAFLHLTALRAGHPLRLERLRPETFLPAMVAGFGGELAPLIRELTALRA